MGQVIGSLVLLTTTCAAVVVAIRLTARADPTTGRAAIAWPLRVLVAVGAVLATSMVVGPILRSVGADPAGMPDDEQLRAGLRDGGASDAEVACIEDRLAGEHGDLEAAIDAIGADVRVLMRAILGCERGLGLTADAIGEFADCFVGRIATGQGLDDVDDLDADELVRAIRDDGPEERMALSVSGLVCQGAPEDVATCIVEALHTEYPTMYAAERMAELTTVQQRYLTVATTRCTGD